MRSLAVLAFLLHIVHSHSQNDTLAVDHNCRKIALVSGISALSAGSFVYLHEAWYKPYRVSGFHFFNDNSEWLQADKAGHVCTAFQATRLLNETFSWAGFGEKTAILAGSGTALAYLTVIELMDGFSNGWGFSWGDEIANLGGAGFGLSQQLAWKEQRLLLKFSYRQSGLAGYNPNLLGENAMTSVLKDYNGQTYWLSFNPFVIAGVKERSRLPWLNLSLGYGAFGMLGGHNNNISVNSETPLPVFERERQYYISLDIDLSRIPVKSKFLRTAFSILNIVKIPAPAMRLSKSGAAFCIR
jgi:hypothetical protein